MSNTETTDLAALIEGVDWSTLTANNDTVELSECFFVRFAIEPDEYADIDDDFFGEFAKVSNGRGMIHDDPRPDHFDGRARKVRSRYQTMWWQPPADVDDVAAMESDIRDLLDWGYAMHGVELIERVTGSFGQVTESLAASAWIGGMMPFADPSESLPDLLHELAADVDAMAS